MNIWKIYVKQNYLNEGKNNHFSRWSTEFSHLFSDFMVLEYR